MLSIVLLSRSICTLEFCCCCCCSQSRSVLLRHWTLQWYTHVLLQSLVRAVMHIIMRQNECHLSSRRSYVVNTLHSMQRDIILLYFYMSKKRIQSTLTHICQIEKQYWMQLRRLSYADMHFKLAYVIATLVWCHHSFGRNCNIPIALPGISRARSWMWLDVSTLHGILRYWILSIRMPAKCERCDWSRCVAECRGEKTTAKMEYLITSTTAPPHS